MRLENMFEHPPFSHQGRLQRNQFSAFDSGVKETVAVVTTSKWAFTTLVGTRLLHCVIAEERCILPSARMQYLI